jgi:ClpP class serine protease
MGNRDIWLFINRLVDEIGTFRDYVLKNYEGAKLIDISKPTPMEQANTYLQNFFNVSSDYNILNFYISQYLRK